MSRVWLHERVDVSVIPSISLSAVSLYIHTPRIPVCVYYKKKISLEVPQQKSTPPMMPVLFGKRESISTIVCLPLDQTFCPAFPPVDRLFNAQSANDQRGKRNWEIYSLFFSSSWLWNAALARQSPIAVYRIANIAICYVDVNRSKIEPANGILKGSMCSIRIYF